MDYTRNIDKFCDDGFAGVSYNQILDVDNTAAIAVPLFDLADFKEYGKIDNSEEDALILLLIETAQRMCEQYVGMNFSARTVIATLNNANGGAYLPYGPIGAIDSITDFDGNAITSDGYKIIGTQFKQVVQPAYEYLQVTYTGGYATCPANLINATKAQALFLYENRGDSSVGMSPVASLILNPLKRI